MGWRSLPMLLALVAVSLGGCATTAFVAPAAFDDSALRGRAETAAGEEIRVRAALLHREEAEAIFGVDLASRGIEPVWLEIENGSDGLLRFLPTGMDPEYFSPREAAFGYHKAFSPETRALVDDHFESLNFTDPVPPGETVSGFVLTNLEEGAKVVNVDLVGRKWSESVTLILTNPANEALYRSVEQLARRAEGPGEVSVESAAELRTLLERLPCCVASEDVERIGPLNVVLIGRLEALGTALQRRGYRAAPLAPVLAFGRRQDLAGTKRARWVPAQPHQLRLWLTDIRFRGEPVWVGQVVTPVGGRFAPALPDGSHAIDPNVDEARIDLVQDMVYAQTLVALGFVKGVGVVQAPTGRTASGPALFHTDGLRAVFTLGRDETSLAEIEFLGWERLAGQR